MLTLLNNGFETLNSTVVLSLESFIFTASFKLTYTGICKKMFTSVWKTVVQKSIKNKCVYLPHCTWKHTLPSMFSVYVSHNVFYFCNIMIFPTLVRFEWKAYIPDRSVRRCSSFNWKWARKWKHELDEISLLSTKYFKFTERIYSSLVKYFRYQYI